MEAAGEGDPACEGGKGLAQHKTEAVLIDFTLMALIMHL